MFPRHVKVCCDNHMTEDDVVVADSVRRDVDRDIVDSLVEGEKQVLVATWWDMLGQRKDMTVQEVRQ